MRLAELNRQINLVRLVDQVCGPDTVRGLSLDHGGVICDPRPGHEEKNASFSVYRKEGCWLWKRHGDDSAGGTAFDFLVHMGWARREAHAELRRLADLPVEVQHPSGATRSHRLSTSMSLHPFNEEEQQRVRDLIIPLRDGDLAATDLKRRGLWGWDGLQVGKLRRNWSNKVGKVLAPAGALVLLVPGPDGQVWGVKVRNLGSRKQLQETGLQRYLYRMAGHGTPAWCSPNYGHAHAVLLVEGELNGAAACLALKTYGMPIDVQGLAGAAAHPFSQGLRNKVVYLHADPDQAGLACLSRLGDAATQAGAKNVRVLLSDASDFCDLLGTLGAVKFGDLLAERLSASTMHHPVAPSGAKSGERALLNVASPQTLGNGAVECPDPLAKYRAKLRRVRRGKR